MSKVTKISGNSVYSTGNPNAPSPTTYFPKSDWEK